METNVKVPCSHRQVFDIWSFETSDQLSYTPDKWLKVGETALLLMVKNKPIHCTTNGPLVCNNNVGKLSWHSLHLRCRHNWLLTTDLASVNRHKSMYRNGKDLCAPITLAGLCCWPRGWCMHIFKWDMRDTGSVTLCSVPSVLGC